MKLRVASGVVRGASLVVVVSDLDARRALRRGNRFIVMVDVCGMCGRSRVELSAVA